VADGGDAKVVAGIAGLLHKHGVPAEAGRQLMADYYAFEKGLLEEQANAFKAQVTQELTTLQGEWGDKFDANKEIADRAFRAFGAQAGIGDAERDAIIETIGLAKAAKLFHAIGSKLGEAQGVTGDTLDFGSKAAVQKQLDDLRQKRIENKIGQKEYLAEMDRLGKMLDAAA
jgi:hypothetical protein